MSYIVGLTVPLILRCYRKYKAERNNWRSREPMGKDQQETTDAMTELLITLREHQRLKIRIKSEQFASDIGSYSSVSLLGFPAFCKVAVDFFI